MKEFFLSYDIDNFVDKEKPYIVQEKPLSSSSSLNESDIKETSHGKFVGCCPFHDDLSPSLNVNDDIGIFKCFSCQAGGDMFEFVQRYERLPFKMAVQRVKNIFDQEVNLTSNKITHIDTIISQSNGNFRGKLVDILQLAASFFADKLHMDNSEEGVRARKYLEDRFISPATLHSYRIGFAPSFHRSGGLIAHLRLKNFTLEEMARAGIVSLKTSKDGALDRFGKPLLCGTPIFKEMLIFPISMQEKAVIGFGARTFSQRPSLNTNLALDRKSRYMPKYINSAESVLFKKSSVLFGLAQASSSIRKQNHVIIVEGYMDVLALHECGVTNAVASMGTSVTPGQLKTASFGGRVKVVMLLDNDEAGIRALDRICQQLLNENTSSTAEFDVEIASFDFRALASAHSSFAALSTVVLKDAADVLEFFASNASLTRDEARVNCATAIRFITNRSIDWKQWILDRAIDNSIRHICEERGVQLMNSFQDFRSVTHLPYPDRSSFENLLTQDPTVLMRLSRNLLDLLKQMPSSADRTLLAAYCCRRLVGDGSPFVLAKLEEDFMNHLNSSSF